MRKRIGIALTGIAMFLMAGQARANLVSNGGFETGDFTGWTQSGDPSFTGVDGSFPNTGSFAAFLGPIDSFGFLSQTISTTPGASYDIDFYLAVGSDDDGGEGGGVIPAFSFNDFNASWDGNQILDTPDAGGAPYTLFHFTETATTSSTPLSFAFINEPSFFFLDDVSVTPASSPVPEPVTATLGLLSLGGLGLTTLRRRAR